MFPPFRSISKASALLPWPRAGQRGFTLIEMLAVMAIIAMLMVFVMPATNGMLKGNQVATSGLGLGDQLGLARQIALSTNHSVEVRFYQYGDANAAGENPTVATSGKWRGVQLFEVLDSGTLRAINSVYRLAPSTMIDDMTKLSSFFPGSDKSPKAQAGAALQYPLPGQIKFNYNAVTFRFLPDGSTDLPRLASDNWFLTVHHINDRVVNSKPPANFFTVQIDPVNGNIRNYRP